MLLGYRSYLAPGQEKSSSAKLSKSWEYVTVAKCDHLAAELPANTQEINDDPNISSFSNPGCMSKTSIIKRH